MYSWLRRSLSRNNKQDTQQLQTSTPSTAQKKVASEVEEDEFYGISDQLIEFIKTLTLDTFKNFPLPEEQNGETQTTSGGVRVDLSEWQQRHATIILTKVKELSHLRYLLCPRHLKERQFWRIYFSIVKIHVTEYELRAIRLDKLRRMATGNEISSDSNGIELEMTEAKPASYLAPP